MEYKQCTFYNNSITNQRTNLQHWSKKSLKCSQWEKATNKSWRCIEMQPNIIIFTKMLTKKPHAVFLSHRFGNDSLNEIKKKNSLSIQCMFVLWLLNVISISISYLGSTLVMDQPNDFLEAFVKYSRRFMGRVFCWSPRLHV